MLFVQSAVCCFQYICTYIWERGKSNAARKKNRRKKTQAKRKKKYRARDKSNRNVENNTQCSEFCLWEAKIVDVSLQIHNKTEANHARTLRYAIAIVPTNRFYYYQLEFLLGLFILFITFSSNAYTWRLPPVLYNHRGFHICVVYLHFSRQIKPTRKILNNLCVRTRDIYNGKCYYRLRAKVKIQFSFYIFFSHFGMWLFQSPVGSTNQMKIAFGLNEKTHSLIFILFSWPCHLNIDEPLTITIALLIMLSEENFQLNSTSSRKCARNHTKCDRNDKENEKLQDNKNWR